VWKLIFNEQTGLANTLPGISDLTQAWLSIPWDLLSDVSEHWRGDPNFYMDHPKLFLAYIIIRCGIAWLQHDHHLAGLQNISKDYYEAAEIDGASKGKQFWHITVPLISPTTSMS
jgi:ABC-type sugar transport system permease subunit